MNEREEEETAVKAWDQFGKSTFHDAFTSSIMIKIADGKVNCRSGLINV